MAQGNRRDEKMRSDRGEWDRKRTGSGNTDKRKKNRRSRPSGRERRAVKKYRLIRSGVLLLFFLTVVLLLRSCIRKVRGTDSMSSDYGTVNVDASEPVIDVQLLDVNPYSRPGTTIDEIHGIVIHYTANPGSTAQENRDYFNGLKDSHETEASSNFVVGLEGEIIQCVKACHQRYGVTVILDTLRGASTAKIRQYQMEENPCYGSCREIPIYRLRQIFHYLLEKGYLSLSNDAYTLVKLTGQSEILLQPDAVLIMKMAREEKKKPKTEKESKKTKTKISGVLSQEDEPLFQRLRQLRMEIAREEKVPPYIVFSDKTLVHMCIIKPHDKEEMLTVSGVGEHKYTKYGEKFLRKINNTQ